MRERGQDQQLRLNQQPALLFVGSSQVGARAKLNRRARPAIALLPSLACFASPDSATVRYACRRRLWRSSLVALIDRVARVALLGVSAAEVDNIIFFNF